VKIAEMMRQEEWELGYAMGLVSTSLALSENAAGHTTSSTPPARAPARDVASLLRTAEPLPPLVVEDFVFPV
jgi:hypothetical protein